MYCNFRTHCRGLGSFKKGSDGGFSFLRIRKRDKLVCHFYGGIIPLFPQKKTKEEGQIVEGYEGEFMKGLQSVHANRRVDPVC